MGLILIAIDESEQAEAAFHFYAKKLHKDGDRLLLLHCADIPHMPEAPWLALSAHTWNEIMKPHIERASKLTKRYVLLVKQYGLAAKVKWFFERNAGVGIVKEAKESGVDHIVMGTRGMGKLRRTIMGSVSDYVFHEARCPVTICRSQKATKKEQGAEGGGEARHEETTGAKGEGASGGKDESATGANDEGASGANAKDESATGAKEEASGAKDEGATGAKDEGATEEDKLLAEGSKLDENSPGLEEDAATECSPLTGKPKADKSKCDLS